MGCAGSKAAGVDVAVADVYRPPPTSVSLFDISAVEEPWVIAKKNKADEEEDEEETASSDDEEEEEEEEEEEDEKPAAKTVVPLPPLLDKLEGYELFAPASWSEVSKALEDMKPALDSSKQVVQLPPAPPPKKKTKKKKTKKKKKKKQQPKQAGAQPPPEQQQQQQPTSMAAAAPPELAGRRVVKDNPFLMRDRETKQAGGSDAPSRWKRPDPFEGCPERRPPGASGGGVVLYTTSLRGVRRTFEDCERAREAVEACAAALGVPGAVDERDVSLHGDYLRELRDLLLPGEQAAPPRLFVMGRYVGGADEVLALADSGKLREMMRWAKARGEAIVSCMDGSSRGCEGCGGARFVPCWECGGSCKVVVVVAGDQQQQQAFERCGKCNENGLMMCPICH